MEHFPAPLSARSQLFFALEPRMHLEEDQNVALIHKLQKDAGFLDSACVDAIGGLRVESPDGLSLARPSNSMAVMMRFGDESAKALSHIQHNSNAPSRSQHGAVLQC